MPLCRESFFEVLKSFGPSIILTNFILSRTISDCTTQSGSAIAHFWRSRLLVTLAKITFTNAQKWALAHNKARDPDSIPMDLADYYDHDEREMNRMMHSSGPERRYMVDQANSSR